MIFLGRMLEPTNRVNIDLRFRLSSRPSALSRLIRAPARHSTPSETTGDHSTFRRSQGFSEIHRDHDISAPTKRKTRPVASVNGGIGLVPEQY
eukprot:1131272-Amorphochlora_amoeboformis.AAC.2